MEINDTVRSLTPLLPTFEEASAFIRIMDGVPVQMYRELYETVVSQRGNPQAQVDWSDPDVWIPVRLEGDNLALAKRLWQESDGILNPRYLRGSWFFSQNHELLAEDDEGVLRLTENGRRFLQQADADCIAMIDSYEGILNLLHILTTQGAGKFSHLLPSFANFCRHLTRYNSKGSITQALRVRLNNLLARDLINRSNGYVYAVTPAGKTYLQQFRSLVSEVPEAETTAEEITPDEPDTNEDMDTQRSLTAGLPLYPEARHFLHVMDRVPYAQYRNTYNEIWEQRGSPQEQVEWANPDEWIPKRLGGEEAALALRLWRESKHALNPRYLRGKWYLTTKHNLLRQDRENVLRVTEKGERFLKEPDGAVVAQIDEYEGILLILRLVAERGPGKRSEFLEEYTEFCRQYTGYRSETPIRGSLYDRLVNLIDRGYVTRSGQVYEITDDGLVYLERYAQYMSGPTSHSSAQTDLRRLVQQMKQDVRDQLTAYLRDMNPFKFEHLIKFLLEEIGYRNVEVTSPTNDKGVDVVADIELGISSVREVVQVKRHRGNIGRRTLDQLRGSLHRFDAMRGTIITTGGFSKGTKEAAFERSAAPITLIDGERLVALLIEHDIGVSKQKVDYLEFDATKLAQFETGEAEEPEV